MADNDASLYNLRFNQVSQQMEAQGGTPSWNALPLGSGGGVAALTQTQIDDLGTEQVSASDIITVTDYNALSGATLTIGSVVLTEGVQWTASGSNDTTGQSLADAVTGGGFSEDYLGGGSFNAMAFPAFSGAAGNGLTVSTDTPAGITVATPTMTGGTDASVPEGTTVYNLTDHVLQYFNGSVWMVVTAS